MHKTRICKTRLCLYIGAIALFWLNACSASPAPTAAPPGPGMTGVMYSAKAQPTAAPAQPTAAPALPVEAPAPTRVPKSASNAASANVTAAPTVLNADIDRKIIKNAQLTFVVVKTDTAIFQITGIANDVGGYIVSNRLFSDNNQRGATIVLAVPVDRFEESLNRIRQVPQEIIQDYITSSDVTDQYIDLEARLKNLEATAARIRDLLTRANTVDEALKINVQLSEIESQIEQIKGKLNALGARTTFSTITVDMREPLPTPTITPTPTLTPTPTPVAWRPDETAARALDTQGNLLRRLGDLLVWFLIVALPYLILLALIVLGARWLVRRWRKHRTA